MKEINLLSKGLFNNKLLDSRVKTRTVSTKEKVLGHLIGPLGLIFIVNTVAALVEKFFMQQVGAMYPTLGDGTANPMAATLGDQYQLVMMIARIIAIGVGIMNTWLISHTKSKQGRMRPWYLIFGFISIIIGALIFLFSPNSLGDGYWIYFFILLACYNTIGSSYFYLFKDTIVSLVTRDPAEKAQLAFFRKLCWTLISGIIIGLIVNSVLIPYWLQNDITGYPLLMIILSICAVPLLLMEYYYTKERIIEDVNLESESGNAGKVPLKAQLKALFTNRFYVILIIIATIQGIVDNFKGSTVQYYYVQYLMGGVENPSMQMIYSIVTGVPLGIGAFIIYPLAKKVGIKNLTLGGYAFILLGSVIGWIWPDQMVPALIAGFLRQFGLLPNAYIFITLTFYAYDDIEFRSGIRMEGLLAIGLVTAVQTIINAPFAGIYESGLLNMGFIDDITIMPDPSQNIKSFMTMCFYLPDLVLAIVVLVSLPFVTVEKKMPEINAELLRRKKKAVLARGEEWIEPEELARREREEAARIHEENRIADLKAYCERKGLNFETENAKYLAAQEQKRLKWEQKQAAKKAKAEAKAAKKKKD